MWIEFLRANRAPETDGENVWVQIDSIAAKIVRQNPALDQARVSSMIEELRQSAIC